MKISTEKSDSYINELSKTKIDVVFSDISYNGFPEFDPLLGEVKIHEVKSKVISVLGEVDYIFNPFKLTINDKFIHKENSILFRNEDYIKHIKDLTQGVIEEIDSNIKLRISKWEIMDYFTVLSLKLYEIRVNIYEDEFGTKEGNGIIYNNKNTSFSFNNHDPWNYTESRYWVNYVLTSYWTQQILSVDRLTDYIKIREAIIEKYDDYVKVISEIPVYNKTLSWEVHDTDLLELITALVESGSIQNSTKSLTRKEAIEFFSEVFGLEIKDAESKLSRATERKKDLSPFLTKLKDNFGRYVQKKDDRTENLRK